MKDTDQEGEMAAEVLVVDDDEDIRHFLQMALTHEGYDVRETGNPLEALAMARDQKPDVMILDFMMPDMTGEEICKAAKEDEALRDTIVVMLSARSDLQTKLRCFDSGADEYLVKPVDPLELTARIGRFLKQRPERKRDIHTEKSASLPRMVVVKKAYGPHTVEGLLGKGAMGQVFKGHDPLLDRPVAIKVLSKQLSDAPEFVERFRREARLLASIDHPGIATVFTFGEEDGEHYFVMQWCAGGSLSEMIQERKTIDVPTAVDQMLQCSKALAAAARKGIVHRDIKPSNLMFDEEGRVMIVDFGLAYSEKKYAHLTAASQIVGTPHYMAPEQSKGLPVDLRTDIYSLGITFYHMLYGQPPFSGSNPIETILKHASEPFPPYRDQGGAIPREVYAVIERMTQKDPAMRYQDYDILTLELSRLQESLLTRSQNPSEFPTIFEKRETLLKETKTKYGVYTLETQVGEDFFGKVYKAYDATSRRYAAVRVLSEKFGNDEVFLKKLEWRIKQLTFLDHSGAGTIYHCGKEEGEYFVAQEWCSGGSLSSLVRKKGRLGLATALPIMLQCVNIFSVAHQAGILHGNLRPNNILFDENQKIRIVDLAWAEAKLSDRTSESGCHFMAPERANASIDLRVDIYSLGVIFYYMLYGIAPLQPGGGQGTEHSLPLYDDVGGAVSREVYAVMEKMTHAQPDTRYDGYEPLIRDLENLRPETPSKSSAVIPVCKIVSEVPSHRGNSFFEMLCKLYGAGESGLLVLRWSVLETRFLVRRREIVFFESNQPGKNVWQSMARARFIRQEDVPAPDQDWESTLLTFLNKSLFTMKDFKDNYNPLLKQAIEEVFIWPECDASFFESPVQNSGFTAMRISDILLEAARSLLDESVIRGKLPKDSLIRRSPMFEQFLSSFNLTSEESFLAYRVEGEDTSLDALEALTGFPRTRILRFVYLLHQIGAIQLRSPHRVPKPIRRESGSAPVQVSVDPKPTQPEITTKNLIENAAVRMDIMKSDSELQVAKNQQVAEEFFRAAQSKHKAGDYWHAAHLCQEAISLHQDEKYYLLLADAYSRHPRFQKDAEESFHDAIRLAPFNPDYHAQLAAFYVERNLLLRARTHCEKALSLVANHPAALEVQNFLKTRTLSDGRCWCLKDEE